MKDQPVDADPARNVARMRLRIGQLRYAGEVRVTSSGLLAVGGLVSSILLSTAVLVGVAVTSRQGGMPSPISGISGRRRRH